MWELKLSTQKEDASPWNSPNSYFGQKMTQTLSMSEALQQFLDDSFVRELLAQVDEVIVDGGKSYGDDYHPKIFAGDVSTQIKFNLKHFAVFLSSTFDDMKFEQDHLLQYVFPVMKIVCERLGLHLSVVSMRWGVRNKAINDHLTSDLCMAQLQRAMRTSAGTSFLSLQSHRYGSTLQTLIVDIICLCFRLPRDS